MTRTPAIRLLACLASLAVAGPAGAETEGGETAPASEPAPAAQSAEVSAPDPSTSPPEPPPAREPGPVVAPPVFPPAPRPVRPSARVSSPPVERIPAVFHLTVGMMGGEGNFALSFDVGLEVHRWFWMYSAWKAFAEHDVVTFNGFKVGYVHPIHRVWGLYGSAGGGRLDYLTLGPSGQDLEAEGGAIVLEAGLMLGPWIGMSGFSFSVLATLPVFTPSLPAGLDASAPTMMVSVSVNPIILGLGILTGQFR